MIANLPWKDRLRVLAGRPITPPLPAQPEARAKDGRTKVTLHGPRAAQSGFSMAITDRLTSDWTATNITNDSILASQLVTIRNRSREFARNNSYVRALLNAGRNNVIGPNGINLQMEIINGIKPQAGEDGTIEWLPEPDDLANDSVEAAWDRFSKPWEMNNRGEQVPHFTTSGKFGRVQFGHLGITTAIRDGEFFYRLVRGYANPFKFSVQPINPDYIDELKNEVLPGGGDIRMGIQRDAFGVITHYWMRTWNPGDLYWRGNGAQGGYTSQPVPASEIRHFYIPDDFDATRGVPWVNAGGRALQMLAGYNEAAAVAARAAACKHEWWERPVDANGEFKGDSMDAGGNPIEDVEPMMREIGPIGWKLNAIDPRYPHAEHSNFVSSVLREFCAGVNCAALTITGDLTQANYSSMRAGLLPEREMWTVIQALWIQQVEMPIFLEWLRMSLLSSAIRLPTGAALPAQRFDKFAKPAFLGRRWPWVDPVKDQAANEITLKQRTGSRIEVIGQQGGDVESTFRNIARVKKLAKKHGITLPEDVEMAAQMVAAQPPAAPPPIDENNPPPA